MSRETLLERGAGVLVAGRAAVAERAADQTTAGEAVTEALRGRGVSAGAALALQPVLGNRGVQGLLARRALALRSAEEGTAGAGARDANGVAAGAETAVARAEGGSGAALPGEVRRAFEGSLGVDLAAVRVHTGAASAEAAHAVGAKAYTVGQDIHFGEGMYRPFDPEGARLVAHEVAHTVQHGAGVTGRHNQLEVSTPGDAAEVEAERAADAMVAGAAVTVGGVGSAVVRERAVMRDETAAPVAAAAPTVAPAPTATPAPTGDPAVPAAATDTVKADWMVDWVGKETADAVQKGSQARMPGDAASGTLKITPSGSSAAKTLPWMNAAPSGAVEVGTTDQPKGKGGTVSTDINYGKRPSVAASVTLDTLADADKKSKPKGGVMKAKQKAASDAVGAKLQGDLATMGDVKAIEKDLHDAAVAAVGDAPEGYHYEVGVAVTPESLAPTKASRAVKAMGFDVFAADETRLVTVTVPTEMQKLKGNKAAEAVVNDQTATGQANQTYDSKTDEHTDSKTTDSINKITTSLSTATSQAWESLKSHATTSSTEISGQGNANLDASAGGALGETGLTIDVGKILGLLFIEDPPVAWALSKVFGTAKVDASAHADYSGHLDLHGQFKKDWSDKDLQSDMSRYDSKVQSKVDTEVSTRVQTAVTNKTVTTHADSGQTKQDASHGTSSKVASSTETVGVNYVVGEPYLTVTKP